MSTAPLGEPSPNPIGVRLVAIGHPPTPAVRRFCRNRPPSWWLPDAQHCAQDHELQRRYGITCDDYWELFARQGGRCAVCGFPPKPSRRLVVDHDHDTGTIDGLCHFGCNRRISTSLRRYLTNPPGRQLGLAVAPAKLRRIQAHDEAKQERERRRREEREAAKARPAAPSQLDKMRTMTRGQ